MKLVILFAILAVAAAKEFKCDFKEKDFQKERISPRSDDKDDAETYADCQKDEELVACDCKPLPADERKYDCDGSYIQATKTGDRCVAKNAAGGKGVQAIAQCQKTVITCSTPPDQDMPSISCPKKYQVLSCTMHTSFIQHLEERPFKPRSKRSGNTCLTTKGCTVCKVQARCLRTSDFNPYQ